MCIVILVCRNQPEKYLLAYLWTSFRDRRQRPSAALVALSHGTGDHSVLFSGHSRTLTTMHASKVKESKDAHLQNLVLKHSFLFGILYLDSIEIAQLTLLNQSDSHEVKQRNFARQVFVF